MSASPSPPHIRDTAMTPGVRGCICTRRLGFGQFLSGHAASIATIRKSCSVQALRSCTWEGTLTEM
eukprot:116519-Pelagomonas_calceolata.AAC.1